jgi:hypothetical protein
MALISGTYSDEDIVKSCLVLELYDISTLSANITAQAQNAKKWVNTCTGREEDFTAAELMKTKNDGIILAASQKTACLMELKRQERSSKISEETKIDCATAETILNIWCHNNGITPASEKKTILRSVEIPFVHSDEEYVI